MTVIWAWLVGFITEILKKFQGLAQITAFLNTPKGCTLSKSRLDFPPRIQLELDREFRSTSNEGSVSSWKRTNLFYQIATTFEHHAALFRRALCRGEVLLFGFKEILLSRGKV